MVLTEQMCIISGLFLDIFHDTHSFVDYIVTLLNRRTEHLNSI